MGRAPAVSRQGGGCPPLSFGYLGSIDAVSSRTAFLVGSRSSLLITRDGGIRWRMVRPLIGDSGGGTGQVIFFSCSRGVVLGEDGNDNELPTIWHTSDGGARWSAVLPRTG